MSTTMSSKTRDLLGDLAARVGESEDPTAELKRAASEHKLTSHHVRRIAENFNRATTSRNRQLLGTKFANARDGVSVIDVPRVLEELFGQNDVAGRKAASLPLPELPQGASRKIAHADAPTPLISTRPVVEPQPLNAFTYAEEVRKLANDFYAQRNAYKSRCAEFVKRVREERPTKESLLDAVGARKAAAEILDANWPEDIERSSRPRKVAYTAQSPLVNKLRQLITERAVLKQAAESAQLLSECISAYAKKTASNPMTFALVNQLLAGIRDSYAADPVKMQQNADKYSALINNATDTQILKEIRAQAFLARLAADPAFQAYSPEERAVRYNEITQTAPQLLNTPLQLKQVMQRSLAQGGLDPADIAQNIIGTEEKAVKTQQAVNSSVVSPPKLAP